MMLSAVRRMGELAKGGDRGNGATGGRTPIGSRKAVANGAGLSSHQLKQAIRVANVPRESGALRFFPSRPVRLATGPCGPLDFRARITV